LSEGYTFALVQAPHDPLAQKLTDALASVDAAQKRLLEESSSYTTLTNGFFEKLALLNGGTIALSVNFISSAHLSGSSGLPRILLSAGWALLLIGMFSALARNQLAAHYRFAALHRMEVEKQIKRYSADEEFLGSGSGRIIYRDSAKPFDRAAEIEISQKNRQRFEDQLPKSAGTERTYYRTYRLTEIISIICTFLGMLALVVFAISSLQF
jgi:hypothetical protein